jgi:hypothetical protein
MFALTSARLLIRECTADEIPALLDIHISNPHLLRQNEGSEGEPGCYDLARWLRDWHVQQLLPGSHRLGCYLHAGGRAVGMLDLLEEHSEDG